MITSNDLSPTLSSIPLVVSVILARSCLLIVTVNILRRRQFVQLQVQGSIQSKSKDGEDCARSYARMFPQNSEAVVLFLSQLSKLSCQLFAGQGLSAQSALLSKRHQGGKFRRLCFAMKIILTSFLLAHLEQVPKVAEGGHILPKGQTRADDRRHDAGQDGEEQADQGGRGGEPNKHIPCCR